MGAASAQLRPPVDAIRHHVLAVTKLHPDDKPVPVLASGNGKIKNGRLRTYVRDERLVGATAPPAVWFACSPVHKGIHPQTQQAKFDDILHADGYAGFNALFE
nr:IS66 family transposase [Janthinobacterium sp. Ant5-2-1]